MHAFTTSGRRRVGFGLAGALCIACATQLDEPPNPGGTAGASADMAGSAGSGGDSPIPTAGSGGSDGAAMGGTAGVSLSAGSGGLTSGSGGVSGSGGHAGSAGASGGGSGGASGAGGALGGGGASGAGGVSGAGGASGGGMGGKAGSGGSGGNGGNGGAGATTCAKNPITAKTKWLVTASISNAPDQPSQACDNMLTTRWSTGHDQAAGQWLRIDFGAIVKLSKLTLQLGSSPNDYPRKYATRFADTPPDSNAPVLVSGMGVAATDTVMTFPAGSTGRYVLIDQSGVATGLWWSVAEILAECSD